MTTNVCILHRKQKNDITSSPHHHLVTTSSTQSSLAYTMKFASPLTIITLISLAMASAILTEVVGSIIANDATSPSSNTPDNRMTKEDN